MALGVVSGYTVRVDTQPQQECSTQPLWVALAVLHGLPQPACSCRRRRRRPRGGSTEKNAASATSQRAARGRQRTIESGTSTLSSSGAAAPERPVAPRTRSLRGQA
eukprot:ctg_466.g252